MRTITAIQEARRMLRREIGREVPDHLITFEPTTEPNRYRVKYELPSAKRMGEVHALLDRICLTPAQFENWRRWRAARDAYTYEVTEAIRIMKEQTDGND